MSKMLSNKKIINEINASQKDYINTRPEMMFKPFVSNRAEATYNLGDRKGGYKSLGQHPRYSASVNGQSAFPDPLFGGAMFNNYLAFNKRYGGAGLGSEMPLNGGYCSSSDSDSDFYSESDSDSESESESDYETMSESDSDSEYSDSDSEYEGGDIYNDYVKPAGKALYNVGTEVFKDVVVPVGKEILKDAIIGLMSGAGRMKGGKITGKKEEFIHILRKINPELSKKELTKKTKNDLSIALYDILKIGMHSKDLETLHYLDALTKNYGQRGGLNGTKKELMKIINAMYPNIDFKNMSKKEIISEIKKEHLSEGLERVKVIKEAKKRGRPAKEKVAKEPKKRGRPAKEKVAKEPKKRGRPVKIKEPKEPKKRGRKPKNNITIIEDVLPVVEKVKKPRKTKSKIDKLLKTDEDEYKEIEKMFKKSNKLDKQDKKLDRENKQIDKYLEKINKEPKKRGKKPKTTEKIVGTEKGESVRGDVVSEYMKKNNVSLGEASKKVKELGLY